VTLTIRDVAREAGVSTATVSRALRGLNNVDPATAAHVRKVADRLDYAISPTASGLASGRTGSVAVLTPYIARWYFSTVLTGIEKVMQGACVDLLLHRIADPTMPSDVLVGRRLRNRVDGFLVVGLPATSPDLVELRRRRSAVTLVGTTSEGMSSVTIDDVEAARTATQHLVNLGHRRIGIIAGVPRASPYLPQVSRLQGYREVLKAARLPLDARLRAYGSFTSAGGEAAMNTLLAQPKPPTGVFAMSDEMAFGAMRALRRHGLQAGTDVALVGLDGHEMADLLELTTVSQPVADLGEHAARDLLERLADTSRGLSEVVLPTTLQVRASTAPPKGASPRRVSLP
jgi:DNA-binding LacI/PurR family transcriptional regulator